MNTVNIDYSENLGIAFVCNYDGKILEVIWDDFGCRDTLIELSHFVSIFDSGSIQKGLAFFLYVKEHGVAFGWEINLFLKGMIYPFHFTAATLGDRLVILGSSAWQGHNKIYEGMSQVISDQVNNMRALTRSSRLSNNHEIMELSDKFNSEIIREMLELNNRLVNAERQLARKNAELRRISAVLTKDLYLAQRVVQCSGEAVIVVDGDHKIIDVNSAYTGITGYTKQESIGTQLSLIDRSNEEVNAIAIIWEIVAKQGHWQGECWGRRKCGEIFPKWLSVSVVLNNIGEPHHYVIIFSDISRLKHAEERWQHLAFYDSLTNLPNRTLFKDRLEQAIVQASRDGKTLALLYIDLDDFKAVNDSLGHEAGDRLLNETAQRLNSATRETDTIYRLGGDEFTIIVYDCKDEFRIIQLCNKIIHVLSESFKINESFVHIGASIGVARFPMDGQESDVLIKNADAAMYAAKESGRNTSRFFSKSLGEKVVNYLNMKTQIAQGLQNKEFCLFLQPEIDLLSGNILSIEALVRWQHPRRGLVEPDDFIPIAEESGLIIELGEFVMCEAIRFVRCLSDLGWNKLRIAVNVSGRQMALPGFTQFIINQLNENKVNGYSLILEITESMVLGNLEHSIEVLQALKAHGIQTAIDDFGTGYSSLSYLHRLPVEFLKIDKSFIKDADCNSESKPIICAISAMAKSLGIKTIAEGIERQTQEVILKELGCDIGQGYLYSKPLSYDDFVVFMKVLHQEEAASDALI